MCVCVCACVCVCVCVCADFKENVNIKQVKKPKKEFVSWLVGALSPVNHKGLYQD